MALATEIEQLKKSSSQNKAMDKTVLATGTGSSLQKSDLFFGVEKWRTENKGPTITRDGTTYNWCPRHKHPAGHYSCLHYKDHDSSTHEEWKKTHRWNTKKGDGEKTAAATDSGEKKKLTIADELKTAFASNLCVSEEDLDKIIAKVNGQEN